ncbi:MAG: Ig-like domain-containing protein [Gemmatimonadota bacterium]
MRTNGFVGALLLLAACGGGGDGPTAGDGVASVSLNAPSLDMLVGRTEQLVATAKDAQGNPVAGAPAATWTSRNPSVATVSASGLVTSVLVGAADVTASVAGKSTSLRVTVTVAATTVTVNMPGLTFAPFRVTVKQGGTVNYVFPSLAHNVIFARVSGAPADIPGQVSNTTVSRVFPSALIYQYSCTIHNGMDGEVEVVP